MGTVDFSRNRVVGWTSLASGVAVGLVIGAWSFDGPVRPPVWIGDYADTSRRLVRLGHIALIGLGLIDILIERELARSALAPAARAVASWAMVIGNVLLPITLFVAAAYHPLKYLMGPPAMSVFLALLLVAYGVSPRQWADLPDSHGSKTEPASLQPQAEPASPKPQAEAGQ